MTITYGIIRNHGGSIDANSIVGIGTTFVILLPLTDTSVEREDKSVVERPLPLELYNV